MRKLLLLIALLVAVPAFAAAPKWTRSSLGVGQAASINLVLGDTGDTAQHLAISGVSSVIYMFDPNTAAGTNGTTDMTLYACSASSQVVTTCHVIAQAALAYLQGTAMLFPEQYLAVRVNTGPSGAEQARLTVLGSTGVAAGFDHSPYRFMANNIIVGATGNCMRVSPIGAPILCNSFTQMESFEIPLQVPPGVTPRFLGVACTFSGTPAGAWEAPDSIRIFGQWRRYSDDALLNTAAFAQAVSPSAPSPPATADAFEILANEPSPYTGSQGFRLVTVVNDTGVATLSAVVICTARLKASG